MIYKDQLKLIEELKIPNNSTKRINCLFCGGKNTLGITKNNGVLKWHCFRASCEAHGNTNVRRTASELKAYLQKTQSIQDVSSIRNSRPIPDILYSINNRPNILNWLDKVHSREAYENGTVTISYYPADNRVLFGIIHRNNSNTIVGYTGRSLNNEKPKWLRYGDTTSLFSCGSGKIGVLVEDAPSACAVGVIPEYLGVALLGSSLTPNFRNQLLNLEQVIICLDPDASKKAIKLNKHLPNSIIRFIPNDLKYFDKQRIKEILKG